MANGPASHLRESMRSLAKLASNIAFYPLPLRVLLLRKILRHLKWLRFETRLQFDAVERPYYAFCIFHAAILAQALGHRAMSIIEFGVAGGNGLVNVERHVEELSNELKMNFEVFGFDLEEGLPKPADYRDMPYMWAKGFYKMDRAALEKKLRISNLVIGDVAETSTSFFVKYAPAPIGCMLFDLDYYSSTRDAFQIFHADARQFLPRVYCYFDDIASGGMRANNRYLGVLQAIEEFNASNSHRKIARISGLATSRAVPASWNERVFVFHDFVHPQYCNFIGNSHQNLPLK